MCEYCDYRKGPKELYDDWHWNVEIDDDNSLYISVQIDYESARIYIPISYCPMCGKRLVTE